MSDNSDDFFDYLAGPAAKLRLDPYQADQVRRLVADLVHDRFAVLQSPTGGGKTRSMRYARFIIEAPAARKVLDASTPLRNFKTPDR